MGGLKKKITDRIIDFGRRHRLLTKPLIALLTLFLALYYGIRELFDMFRSKKFRMRFACLLAAGAMLFTQINPLLASQGSGDGAGTESGTGTASGSGTASGADTANGAGTESDAGTGYSVDSEAEMYGWFTDDESAAVFYIGNEKELSGLANLVNGTAEIDGEQRAALNFINKKIILTDDIDLTGIEWTPIGITKDIMFRGSFDGDGHTVSGLRITDATQGYRGLFGYIVGGGKAYKNTISNLTLDGCDITSSGQYIGGVAGYAYWTQFRNITVRNTRVVGGEYVGGMVGVLFVGDAYDCTAEDTVSLTSTGSLGRAGGVASHANQSICTISNCIDKSERNYTGIKYIGGRNEDPLRIVWDYGNQTVRFQYNAGFGPWVDYYDGGTNNTHEYSLGNFSGTALIFTYGPLSYQYNTTKFRNYDGAGDVHKVLPSPVVEVSDDGTVLTAKYNGIKYHNDRCSFDLTFMYTYNGGRTMNRSYTFSSSDAVSDVKLTYGGALNFLDDNKGYDYAIWPPAGSTGTKMLLIKKKHTDTSPIMYMTSPDADGYYTGQGGESWAKQFQSGNFTNNGYISGGTYPAVNENYYLRWDMGALAAGEKKTVSATEGVDMSGTPIRVIAPVIPAVEIEDDTPKTAVFVLNNVTEMACTASSIEVSTPEGSPVSVSLSSVNAPVAVAGMSTVNVPVTVRVSNMPDPPQSVDITFKVVDDKGNLSTATATVRLIVHYGLTYDYAANGGYGADISDTSLTESLLGFTTVRLSGDGAKTANKDGWEFVGWNTEKDAESGLEQIKILSDTTLYAIYSRKLTGKFYANDGTDVYEQKETVIYNNDVSDSVIPAEPVYENHIFTGWYTQAEGGERADETDGSVLLDADKSFYAHWRVCESNVSFDYQGATGGNTVPSKTVALGGAYGELPAPEKTGLTFKGWYTEPDGGGTVITEASTVTETSDHTLYAFWRDETAPDKPVLKSGVTLPAGWTNSQDKIPLTLRDNIGVTQLWVSVDGADYTRIQPDAFTGASEISYDYTPVIEGKHTYRFKAKDAAGNESEESDIFAVNLDTERPSVISLEYNPVYKNFLNWIIKRMDLVITVTVSDGYSAAETNRSSGVSNISYQMIYEDGEKSKVMTADVVDGKAQINVFDGWKGDVRITCTDAAGNVSDSVTVSKNGDGGAIVEDIAPSVRFTANGKDLTNEVYDTAPSIKITVIDDKKSADLDSGDAVSGGIAYITYKIGNGAPITVYYDGAGHTELTYRAEIEIEAFEIPEGETKISVTAVDNAGNITGETSCTVNVKRKSEVTVELHKGGTNGDRIGSAVLADEDGTFNFEGIPRGMYSLVIKRTLPDGRVQVLTKMIEVKSQTVEGVVSFPEGEFDTIVNVGNGGVSLAANGLDTVYDPAKPAASDENGVTAKDLELIAAGADLQIKMAASKLGVAAASEDAKVIGNVLDEDEKIGMMFDLSVSKELTVNGETKATKLTEIPDELTVVLSIPEDIQGYTGYAVVRLHNGEVDILDTQFDEELNTLTFKSSKYSTYAVIYTVPRDVPASYLPQPDPDPSVPYVSFFVWLAAITLISSVVIQDYAEKQRKRCSK